MLSRTADHLFWMARYMERAENTARMLDVTLKALLLPQSGAAEARVRRAVLNISELDTVFDAHYDAPTREHVLSFMSADPDNQSSIYCCLQSARENARAVRGTLTTEAWETINDTWLEFNRLLQSGLLGTDPTALFEWVKFRSHLSRGVTLGTALRDEAFYFTQLGTFLERADNTARLLDVRFVEAELARDGRDQRELSGADGAAAHLDDFYYWASVLAAVSGLEIYRKVYRDVVTPERVIELLTLNSGMPRSLLASLDAVCENLAMLRTDNSQVCERMAGKLRAEVLYADLREVMDDGLHPYLTEFLARVFEIGNSVAEAFLLPAA